MNRWAFGVAAAVVVLGVRGSARAQAEPGAGSDEAAPAALATPSKDPPPPLASAPPVAKSNDDQEGEPRLSLPTEADRDAWQRSGFRFGLGLSFGRLQGLAGAPSGTLLGVLVRLGLRLDGDWSLLTSFQYQRATSSGGLDGLRFAGTLDPTWHVTPQLALAIGLGFGGIIEANTGRPDILPLGSSLATSYTFPSADPPLPTCSGVGVAGLARAEWSFVLGPRASTSLLLEGTGQWTGCVADTGNVDNDSGQAIVRRQWWPHLGGQVAWGISWR